MGISWLLGKVALQQQQHLAPSPPPPLVLHLQ